MNKELVSLRSQLDEMNQKIVNVQKNINKELSRRKKFHETFELMAHGEYERIIDVFSRLKVILSDKNATTTDFCHEISKRIGSLIDEISNTDGLLDQAKKLDIILDFHKKRNVVFTQFDSSRIKEIGSNYLSYLSSFRRIGQKLGKIEFHEVLIEECKRSVSERLKELNSIKKEITMAHYLSDHVSLEPSNSMKDAKSYEFVRFKHFLEAQSGFFQRICQSHHDFGALPRIAKNSQYSQSKIKQNIIVRAFSPYSNSVNSKKLTQKLAKEELNQNKTELNDYLSENEEIRSLSPDMLLAKYLKLLEDQKRNRLQFQDKIQNAQNKLHNTKVIKRARLNSLKKTGHSIPDDVYNNLMKD